MKIFIYLVPCCPMHAVFWGFLIFLSNFLILSDISLKDIIFQLSSSPAELRVENVKEGEEGVYRFPHFSILYQIELNWSYSTEFNYIDPIICVTKLYSSFPQVSSWFQVCAYKKHSCESHSFRYQTISLSSFETNIFVS